MFAVVMREVDLLPGARRAPRGPAGPVKGRHRANSDRVLRGRRFFSLKEMSDDSLIGFIDAGLKMDQ